MFCAKPRMKGASWPPLISHCQIQYPNHALHKYPDWRMVDENGKTHLIIDRDTKYCDEFRQILQSADVNIVLGPHEFPPCNG